MRGFQTSLGEGMRTGLVGGQEADERFRDGRECDLGRGYFTVRSAINGHES